MLFNSFIFAGIFLPLCLLFFWLAPTPRSKRAVLLLGSLIFYAYWLPAYLAILLVFVTIAWGCALLIERTQSAWPVWLAGLILFGGLAYYKYLGFLMQVASDIGLLQPGFRVPELALPLGISFIVFQAMGYVIDVHRREFKAEPKLSLVLLFKAFFPQLIAGPICRAHELMPQLRGVFTFKTVQFMSGLAIFALGLFLKEFFADGMAPIVDSIYASQTPLTFAAAWSASIGFGGQIYADFWAYSTMAVGLARMFGIDIPTNFRLPYIATSLREFWRRWHITLSQWLRDYLYKPLGGSRHGRRRTIFALLATMLLGGLWHGANYTFIVWGALHGFALVLEHMFLKPSGPKHTAPSFARVWLGGTLRWTYTFLVVFVAWVFFRATDITQATHIISTMFSNPMLDASLPQEIKQIGFFIVLLAILQFPIEWLLAQLRRERLAPAMAIAIAFWALVAAVVFGAPTTVPFIYFQF